MCENYEKKKGMKEYPCAYCQDEIEVDGNEREVICKSCGLLNRVNYDAEFIDGMWKDNTSLTKTIT